MAFRDIHVGRNGFLRLLAAIAGEAAEKRVTRASRFRAVQVFARQGTEAQTGVGEQLHLFVLRHLRQTHFITAVQQAVRVLNGHDARQIVFIGQMQIAHHAKRRLVGNANVADLTRPLALRERFQRFQQGNGRSTFVPGVAKLTEAVRRTLRPVHLIKIEIVGLQALEAGIQRGTDILAIEDLVRADPGIVITGRAADFGGDDQLFAIAAFRQPVADIRFSKTLCFRAGRNGVHLRHVNQVNALADGVIELCMGIGFAVLFTKCHGAQPQLADLQSAMGDTVIMHSRFPFLDIQTASGTSRQRNINMAEGRQKGKEKIKKASKLLTFICLTLDDLGDFVAINLHLIAFAIAVTHQTGIVVDFGFAIGQDHTTIFR